jgi:hypothetical protein
MLRLRVVLIVFTNMQFGYMNNICTQEAVCPRVILWFVGKLVSCYLSLAFASGIKLSGDTEFAAVESEALPNGLLNGPRGSFFKVMIIFFGYRWRCYGVLNWVLCIEYLHKKSSIDLRRVSCLSTGASQSGIKSVAKILFNGLVDTSLPGTSPS